MSNLQQEQYVKMTQTPIPKLIIGLSIPTTISMLITNIYNMADTFFVSKISISASGATGIVFSIMAILQAFGFMFGHGAGSNISRQLGAKRVEKAKTFASTSYFLAVLMGVVIMVIGIIFLEPIMYLLGSTDTILNEAKRYALFIFIAGPAMTTGCVLNNILRYEGKATFAMVGLTTGGIINMLIDPLLIFGLNLGIAGAGIATAISQYISSFVLLIPFMKNKTVTKISFKYITHEFDDVINIIVTGLPSFFRQSLNSISTSVLNIQAKAYGDEAIAAMSVVSRCGNLLFSAALGLGQGFQPVSAFNYGSKDYKRVKEGFYFTTGMGVAILGVLCIICFGNSEMIIRLFRTETLVVEIGATALKYLCMALYLLPISAVGSMLFQSIGESKKALFLSVSQSGLLYVPFLMILPRFLGLTGIEIALPLAYFFVALITIPMVLGFFRKLEG
ncbi:MAG: MATE family efflux transporter [Erysipelotrichaceae bacterium]|nr:MATE family efflux transporter [Erysipelotrichaceae bacterium]